MKDNRINDPVLGQNKCIHGKKCSEFCLDCAVEFVMGDRPDDVGLLGERLVK